MATDITRRDDRAPAAKPISNEVFPGIIDDWAAGQIIGAMVGPDAKGKRNAKAVRDAIREHADELAGPSPSALERHLAETAALCAAQLRYIEVAVFCAENRSLARASYDERRWSHAHRRYLGTMRTLATVRRLGVPVVQLNVANQQVNVAGSS